LSNFFPGLRLLDRTLRVLEFAIPPTLEGRTFSLQLVNDVFAHDSGQRVAKLRGFHYSLIAVKDDRLFGYIGGSCH
jgi:hypothetical protein